MLEKRLLDERTAIIVFLLLERLKGERSRYAPYIQALPKRCANHPFGAEAALRACRACLLLQWPCTRLPGVSLARQGTSVRCGSAPNDVGHCLRRPQSPVPLPA